MSAFNSFSGHGVQKYFRHLDLRSRACSERHFSRQLDKSEMENSVYQGRSAAVVSDKTPFIFEFHIEKQRDYVSFQHGHLCSWSQLNSMDFYIKKCKLMRISRKKQPMDANLLIFHQRSTSGNLEGSNCKDRQFCKWTSSPLSQNCSIACVEKLWTQTASLSIPWICICLYKCQST
ncbi:uncharacterized protein [Acropora muricata]|uniref:uncharacterized protein isoform X1 n=1 Tax=Acropora muricata TaxID=159855 RepID=UPI0034E48D66